MKALKVTCDTKLHVQLDELNELQGGLKEMTQERYEKFRRLVTKKGIWFTLHVWAERTKVKGKAVHKWWVIDGHGRIRMFRKLRDDDGFKIPPIPCVEIQAKDLKEAKEAVLAATSQFHRTTRDGLYQFLSESELGPGALDDYDLPDIDIPKFKAEFYEEPKKKTVEFETNDEAAGEKKNDCPRCGYKF